jgi:hypothetical protein
MFTTIITDCKGENEKGRQIVRLNSLGLGPTNLVGVQSNFTADATTEAGANLIDILDATQGKWGVIVVNVAPRGNKKKDGINGTPFAYFYYKNTLIVSTIKGYCLSFIKAFGICKDVNLLNMKETLNWAVNEKLIKEGSANYIGKSQFRSFDFVPRVVKWIANGKQVPSKDYSLSSISHTPNCIWHIDTFGNAKTTITNDKLPLKKPPLKAKTNLGTFASYDRLKDIPKGETAVYIGSSGFGKKRFLEIATQGIPGSAGKQLKLNIGQEFKIM